MKVDHSSIFDKRSVVGTIEGAVTRTHPSVPFGRDVQIFSAEVRHGDNVDATLKGPGISGSLGAQVWRICPFGIEIVWPSRKLPSVDSGYEIELVLRDNLVQLKGIVTDVLPLPGNRSTVALRFCSGEVARDPAHERRQHVRWNCSMPFAPTGVASNPLQFRDVVYLTVVNISAEGVEFVTSLRNKHLIPGVSMNVDLTLPGQEERRIALQILHISVDNFGDKPMFSVGAKFISPTPAFLSALGQYLLMFGANESVAPTLESLKKAGMITHSLGDAVSFTWVRNEADYHEVLKLRHAAFSDVTVDTTLDDVNQWADVFDSRARILLAKYRGQPIGTMRLIYNDADDAMEVERFVALPPGFHAREDMVEVGRLCIHPAYRHSDLILHIFVFFASTVLRSGRRYFVANGSDKMTRTYRRFGCELVGLSFVHNIDQKVHHVVRGDLQGIVSGADVDPFTWNVVFRDLWSEIGPELGMDGDLRTRVRLFFYRMLAPLARLGFDQVRMRRLR